MHLNIKSIYNMEMKGKCFSEKLSSYPENFSYGDAGCKGELLL